MSDALTLSKHTLAHIADLKVSDGILRSRFASYCSMSNCEGKCCCLGVDVDIGEQVRILKNADLIRSQMDDHQERDPTNWFGDQFADPDFPSGRAVTTRLYNGACVFLNKERRCVAQMAEAQAQPETGNLKPFFCRAYPVCIEDGFLTIDEHQCTGEVRCCGSIENGTLTIFDICAFELEYVLGEDGLNELRKMARETAARSEDL